MAGGTAREMARRIQREQERFKAERKKATKELGFVGLFFLVCGSIVATLGVSTDNVHGLILGGVVMLAGVVFGILWAVSDDH